MTARCRRCAGELEVVLDLGDMPLANRLLSEDELALPEPRYPLALGFCDACCLAQITETVSPDLLFRDYAYFSSVSDAMVEHARELVDRLAATRDLGSASLIVELASNDGYLLRHYVRRGIPVLGIDPARNIAEAATASGIPTLPEFFGRDLADELAMSGRLADVVHANNVLAHVPDLDGFVAGIARILKPGGVAVIETPYVRDLVDRLEFDTIYHEHLFYYSVSSLTRVFARHGLAVTDVEPIPIHGGSLRVFVTPAGAVRPAPIVGRLIAEEARLGLCSAAYFRGFATRVNALGDSLRGVLGDLKERGQSIAAYGAAAKGATLLNAFGIGRETIDFVVDRSPHKQGFYMPGVKLPILPTDRLSAVQPDACVLLAWNFADEILSQQAAYRTAGGRFVIPVPTVRMV
jgi:2-polyprenyl-3-methyl-5-hydroxy-6-metoxy-1,4-benzoquinol methylase